MGFQLHPLKCFASSPILHRFIFPCALLLVLHLSAQGQGASTVTRSFDFRNGALGWQAGFADYPPGTDKNNFYELKAEIRSLPSELGGGSGFFIQGANHSDDLFMFLKRRLDSGDGIVAGQTYEVTFTIVFGSNAQTGCAGAGGQPGESVWLKAGGSPGEPLALLQPPPSDPHAFSVLRMNVDKADQSQSGIAASVAGNIANGDPCDLSHPPRYVSVQRAHRHTSLVNANSKGELWLLLGTDSGFEATTALYYQRIDVTLVPVPQQSPVLLTYVNGRFENTGRVAALESVNHLSEPLAVVSEQNFLSPDRRTRINLFAYNLELKAGEDMSAITAAAEDSQSQIHNLPVEAVNEVPNFNWITQVTVKLPDELQGAGTVLVSVKLRGLSSNKLPFTIK